MRKRTNPNLPADTVTLDRHNLDKKLYVDNSMPGYAYMILLFFGCFALYGLNAVMMSFTGGEFNLNALTQQPLFLLLPFYAGIVTFAWFVFGLLRGALSPRPKNFKVQTHHFYGRFAFNLLGFIALTLIFAALIAIGLEAQRSGELPDLSTAKEHLTDLLPSAFFGLVFGLIGLYLWQMSLRYLFRIGGWFWNRVKVMAVFDRESYATGDSFQLRISDRASENGNQRYRVHLSYVQEYMRKMKDRKDYARRIVTSSYRDVTAGELHRGIEWTVPETEGAERRVTNLSRNKKPAYWELLVEAHDSHFHARFFVNVR